MRELEVVAAFSASLPIRPDAVRVRHVLAEAFIAHANSLWPAGDQGSPAWFADNVEEVLATIERLYAVAAEGDHPGAAEFLDRLSWLPPLLADLDQPGTRLGG